MKRKSNNGYSVPPWLHLQMLAQGITYNQKMSINQMSIKMKEAQKNASK